MQTRGLKKHYIISKKTSITNGKNTYKKQVCNKQKVKQLPSSKVKGALLDFKRALIRALKSIFCNPKGRLLEAKRACVGFELHENNLQI